MKQLARRVGLTNAERREFFSVAALKKARAGEPGFEWLRRLVLEAGYVPPGVATTVDVARVFRVSVRTVQRWIGQGMPVLRRGRGGRPTLFDVAAVLRWRDERGAAAREARKEMLADRARSRQWLEEYRRQKALQIKRQNEIEAARLVSRSTFARQCEVIVQSFEKSVRRITRRVERAAGREISRAVDEFKVLLRRVLGGGVS